jgi:hypothetical protein
MKQVPPAHKVVGDEGKPGQLTLRDLNEGRPVKYLRDIIRKYQDEDRPTMSQHKQQYREQAQEPSKGQQATMPLSDAEKSLEKLKQALQELCEDYTTRVPPVEWVVRVQELIKENT